MFIAAMGVLALLQTSSMKDADTDFIARVEQAKLLDSAGKALPRVERDENGAVLALTLNGMKLTSAEIASIGHIKTLRRLTLYHTNITNADIKTLSDLPRLEGLNLTSTEISDPAIDEIIKMKSLRSLCLGDVAINQDAVARLKDYFRAHHRQLSLGYYRRK